MSIDSDDRAGDDQRIQQKHDDSLHHLIVPAHLRLAQLARVLAHLLLPLHQVSPLPLYPDHQDDDNHVFGDGDDCDVGNDDGF